MVEINDKNNGGDILIKLQTIRIMCACIALISCSANAATLQFAGYPAPGGTSAFGTGDPGKNDIEGLGRTWTLSGFDDTAYDTLYYVVGDYPSGIWDSSGVRIGTGSMDLLSYDAGASDFVNGKVSWTGSTTFNIFGAPETLNARFTLSVTDTAGNAQSLIDASSIAGMPTSVGAAYEVTGDFKANWLFELMDPTSGNWVPAKDEYDLLATDAGTQLFTSSGGAFYYTSPVPVPAAVWLFGSGLLGLVGVARRKKS